jgi:Flp pilus assembly protein TadB
VYQFGAAVHGISWRKSENKPRKEKEEEDESERGIRTRAADLVFAVDGETVVRVLVRGALLWLRRRILVVAGTALPREQRRNERERRGNAQDADDLEDIVDALREG